VIALAGGASAGAAAADTAAPRAALTQFVCHRAKNQALRSVSVTGVMRPLTGTQRMALRFELLSKAPGQTAFSDISGPGLGTWLYPTDPATLGQRPGDVWRLNKPVINLASATYRFRVAFRWLGANGSVLGTTVRLSPRCEQG
jgi:hypothetical protein